MLVFRSGKVVWSASHFKITRKTVTRAVQRAASRELVDEPELEFRNTCGRRSTLSDRPFEKLGVVGWLRSLWDQQWLSTLIKLAIAVAVVLVVVQLLSTWLR